MCGRQGSVTAGQGSRPSSAARGVLPPTELNVQRLSAAHKQADQMDLLAMYALPFPLLVCMPCLAKGLLGHVFGNS